MLRLSRPRKALLLNGDSSQVRQMLRVSRPRIALLFTGDLSLLCSPFFRTSAYLHAQITNHGNVASKIDYQSKSKVHKSVYTEINA
jgi:hypothetical protein